MKKNEVKKVMENAEVKVEVKEKKQKKQRVNFPEQIIKRVDNRAKNLDISNYIKIRESIISLLLDLEILIEDAKVKAKQEKVIFKRLAKFSEEDIRMYLNQINEVK